MILNFVHFSNCSEERSVSNHNKSNSRYLRHR